MVQYERPCRSSWTKLVWSSLRRTGMGKAIRESSIGARLGKSSELGMLIRFSSKRINLICACGRHQIGWHEWIVHFHRKLMQLFFLFGRLISICSYSFWRRSNYFLSSWTVAVFDLGGILFFLWYTVFPLCGLSCLHFFGEGNIQPLWKVKGFEQYTSWNLRVPDCVSSVRNEQNEWHRHVYEYAYIYIYIYMRAKATHMVSVSCVCVYVRLCVFACLCAEQAQWKWMLGHVHLRPTVILTFGTWKMVHAAQEL